MIDDRHSSEQPRTRAEINRENAAKSTGPKSEAGKNRAKLNAVKHALTAQTILGAEAELVGYHHLSTALKQDLRPVGEFETQLVQSIADAQWQLYRSRAIENNILFAATARRIDPQGESENFEIDWAGAQAQAFLENAKQLDLMSRYGSRYHRQVLQLHAALAKIQKERKNFEYERHRERKQRHNQAFAAHQNQAAQGNAAQRNQSNTKKAGFVSQPQTPASPYNPARQGGDAAAPTCTTQELQKLAA